ncbi:unnamed protein product [Periconia digitata]|uniref:Uncharacterized protein n=1 Tax=Periconia digitata TaxID=1303443 RepID=A0A9W4UAY4_9PLEO|nr:unnamed protein product [Periconia digitata]
MQKPQSFDTAQSFYTSTMHCHGQFDISSYSLSRNFPLPHTCFHAPKEEGR